MNLSISYLFLTAALIAICLLVLEIFIAYDDSKKQRMEKIQVSEMLGGKIY